MSESIAILALYQFVHLTDHVMLKQPLLDYCQAQQIKGTFLLAQEGINGTVAGNRTAIDQLLHYLQHELPFNNLEYKLAAADFIPFRRMKIKLKKEIVTLRVPGLDPTQQVGTYVDPENWNALLNDPEVVLIDTRNEYEYAMGTFKNAVNPHTEEFAQFPTFVTEQLQQAKNKKIAMFCTGGIRCEKASAYLLQQGFSEVYHLKGGILNYLQRTAAEESLWQGDCFVFDERERVA